jgi:hypothetical protein
MPTCALATNSSRFAPLRVRRCAPQKHRGERFWGGWRLPAPGYPLPDGRFFYLRANIASLKALIEQWKGPDTKCRMFIFAYDEASFDPSSPPGAAGMPDGYWGFWSKDNGSGGRIKARRSDARYVEV